MEISPESFTFSIPEATFGKWIKQKKRHLAAGKHYTTASRNRIAGELLSRILLYGTFIAICIVSNWYLVALATMVIMLAIKCRSGH